MNEIRSPFRVWLMAARPRTLPAAVAPVIVGSALAFSDGGFRWGPALAAALGALLLQVGANLANDVFDFQHGADTSQRMGPTRVTQSGLLTPRQVKLGMAVVFGLAALCGVYLTFAAGWPVLVIGLLSIVAAVAYTGGPYPLGYHGLGEVFVFLFFGVAAVGGTYFVHTRTITWAVFASCIPIGCLVVAILVVNNLRDIPTDRLTGKRTLAVRFGEAWTRGEYVSLLAAAYLSLFLIVISGLLPPWIGLSWLSLPLAIPLIRSVYSEQGRALNRVLGGTGQLELAFSLLFALGLVIAYFL
jgi:1,4-dihydroxy-2-naphthoate polyprenyltransferase